jgi:hypothetical protein
VKLVCVLMLLATMFALSTSPASAWWQFVANGPNSERQVSPRFATEKECKKRFEDDRGVHGQEISGSLSFGW